MCPAKTRLVTPVDSPVGEVHTVGGEPGSRARTEVGESPPSGQREMSGVLHPVIPDAWPSTSAGPGVSFFLVCAQVIGRRTSQGKLGRSLGPAIVLVVPLGRTALIQETLATQVDVSAIGRHH